MSVPPPPHPSAVILPPPPPPIAAVAIFPTCLITDDLSPNCQGLTGGPSIGPAPHRAEGTFTSLREELIYIKMRSGALIRSVHLGRSVCHTWLTLARAYIKCFTAAPLLLV